MTTTPSSSSPSLLSAMRNSQPARLLQDGRFLGGMAAGAAVAMILGNESFQRAVFRGIARVGTAMRAGVEEVKERFHDAEAEIRMEPGEEEGDIVSAPAAGTDGAA